MARPVRAAAAGPRRRLRPPSRATADLERMALALITLAVVAFGLIMVYSAASGTAVVQGGDPLRPLLRQSIYAVVGLVAMVVLARTPYRRLRVVAPVLMLVALALLAAVMVPGIGTEVNGARRWIYVGPLSVQPSELAKLALLLFASAVFAARRRPPATLWGLLNPVGLVALVACALIVLEPDLGTAIAVVLMLSGIAVAAGTSLRLCGGLFAAATAATSLAIYAEPYRRARLLAFLDPWQDPAGDGYQNVQALIALGSGGIFGVGLGNGVQKITYLPEAPTDMIVAVIGEELGLAGVLLTVLAFAAFGFLGFRVAMRCGDPLGRLLATGITSVVTGQAIVNLGAVLGLLPLTGVPLPLVSSGGSSLVVSLAMVGILLNVAEDGRTAGARGGRTSAHVEQSERNIRGPAAARAGRGGRDGGTRRAGAGGRRRAVG